MTEEVMSNVLETTPDEAVAGVLTEAIVDCVDIMDVPNVRFYGDTAQRAALLACYAKYMGEVTNPNTTKMNPFTKSPYAPLDEVLNTVRPILAKHGLAVTQAPMNGDDGKVYVQTLLIHADGGMMVFPPFGIPAKNDAQGTIAALTYARRGALNPILATHGEMDDDGNTASGKPNKKSNDEIDKLKAEVLTIMQKKSDVVGRDAVFAACEKVAGAKNPNAIKDVETLKKVKAAVEALKK